jgi:parallel beta-helix repeat protein
MAVNVDEDYSQVRAIDSNHRGTIESEPIVINNNSDFSTYGFEGNGSFSDPYLIENLHITSNDDCITIGNISAFFIVRNCILKSLSGIWGSGIFLRNVSHAIIESCTISSKYFGLDLFDVSDCSISNVSTNYGWYGVSINESKNVVLLDSFVIGNIRTGVELRNNTNCSVQRVSIHDNSERGIYVVFSTACNVTDSTIMNNQGDGIYLYYSDSCLIRGNGIYDNRAYGTVITLGNDNQVFDNGFGWNALSALDNGNNNTWDFVNTSSGNYWSDFDGNSNYAISGSAESEDRFPDYIIRISHPPNNEYLENTTLASITWECQAFRPNRYRILANSVIVEDRKWNGFNINFNFSLSEVGLFNFTIILFDDVNHFVSDSVSIMIWDITTPTINHPEDIEYLEGFPGSVITWIPYDTQPRLFQIFRNNIKLISAGWEGEAIQIDVSGLKPGTYYYKVVVYDLGGNSIEDIVKVTVLEDPYQTSTTTPLPTPTTSIPQNPWYSPVLGGLLFLVGSLIILVAVLIQSGLLLKKQES